MANQRQNDGWLWGVKSIAGALGVGVRTLERWLVTDETELPVSKIGGRWNAHADDLQRWKRQQG
ncbi:MAG: hypothetical protein A3D16_09985 [Rhodobacterales bacterium RIFCSPHIGHO2_02_FULL_62_130]|nr:MAG: hypothetical protein A3D16_09985 [Rhodobacterales bacterium RIFCSPHIGHO2_02_FULL_62_130]OHC56341.1 MAG: hypothetical protein A3E48_20910 [Rhodobacterales bacterium RIFCSPHIGHO2_12_FULL_62_75]